jgi:hypothetical protein
MAETEIEKRYTVFVRPRMMEQWRRESFWHDLRVAIEVARSLYNAGNYDAEVYDNDELRVVFRASEGSPR